MNHIALYRAYRPRSFQDMVGQQHITTTLQNSLREHRFSHAYLFCGPRGTGKTSAAKLLARAVNCEQGPVPEPCNECEACRGIADGSILDVVEIDAASNRGVEEIRDVRDKVKYAPTAVRYKVYIIDEVHMLTTEAFNALLKTLEEPPAHVMFILATTEPGRIPATIVSRCQRFDFRRITLEDQRRRLEYICEQENIAVEPSALELLARLSDGGMRDALSMLDQVVSFSGDQVTYADVVTATGGMASEQFSALAHALKSRDIAGVMSRVEELMTAGKSVDKCMESLIQYYRDLLLIKMMPDAHAMTGRILDPAYFKSLAQDYEQDTLFRMIDTLNRYHVEMKHASQPQILFEIALMKLCTVEDSKESELAEKLAQLEKQVETLTTKLKTIAQGATHAISDEHTSNALSNENMRRKVDRQSMLDHGGSRGGRVNKEATASPTRRMKSESFLKGRDSAQLKEILVKWSQVLQRVKEAKITVHAWLVDGEPVSVSDEAILLAFKNTIHRETTEKQANRQLIEQMMQEVYGKTYTLQTVMLSEWKKLLATQVEDRLEQTEEVLELVPEDGETGHTSESQEEWVKEAVTMFGQSLVVIKDE